MKKIEFAASAFNLGVNCSQAVLTAYSGEFKLTIEELLKISCGFGGGMKPLQETCGAVTGAFMIIGLKHGENKEETVRLVKEFAKKFKNTHKTTNCKELIKCDLNRVC